MGYLAALIIAIGVAGMAAGNHLSNMIVFWSGAGFVFAGIALGLLA